jgi:GT2 family glycosyltransferase
VNAAKLSVIVPAWNAAATIERCLAPLAAMRARGEIAEVIVVDDGSTDATPRLAAAHGARVIESGGRVGPGGARNVAAKVATGDTLWFVDADVVVHDDAARVLVATLRSTGAAAVFGAYDDAPDAPNFFSQYKNLVHHFYHSEEAGETTTFWAGCGAVRKDAFLAVGGFDGERFPYPSIEDIDLGLRLAARGARIWLAPQMRGTHLKEWRLLNLLHTDIFRRAVPWSRLIHAEGGRADLLNLRAGERARALLAIALAASIVAALLRMAPAWLPLPLAFAAIAANPRLFALFRRRRGALFALGGMLFHQVYYVYASAAFGWVWLASRGPGARSSSSAR